MKHTKKKRSRRPGKSVRKKRSTRAIVKAKFTVWDGPLPRNCKLTPELQKTILTEAQSSLYETQLALRCGIHPDTLRNYLDWGMVEDAVEPYKTFAEQYMHILAEQEAEALSAIRKAGDPAKTERSAKLRGDWKAKAWYLSKRFPLRYGDHLVPDGGPTEAYRIPATKGRDAKAIEAIKNPSPGLLRVIDQAGYVLVPKVTPALTQGDTNGQAVQHQVEQGQPQR